jgi:uncharacterized membrane protein
MTVPRGRKDLAPLVYLLVLLFMVFFCWLSVMRHEMFQSAALDLGYTTQVVWNTLHGRCMQFSTLENTVMDLPLGQFRRTDILLAYHVELLLAPMALLYLIHDSPVTLLVLQSVVVGLGALPAFWLTRRRLASDFAGLVFALAYLLAPAIQGAVLSDFHAVSLTASLLLFALYFLDARRYGLCVLLLLTAMLTKEDIPLIVFLLGLSVLVRSWLGRRSGREEVLARRFGAGSALMGLAWFLIAAWVILPGFSGLSRSPFLGRLAVFGPTVADSLRRGLAEPVVVLAWLQRPEVTAYLGGLLASAGFMSLFSPLLLAVTAPVAAVNVFSNWSWTYSEGAHYSASLVPFVIASAIYGTEWLARQISRRTGLPQPRALQALAAFVLVVSGFHHWQIGMTPLARDFAWPQVTAHHRLGQEFIRLIPADAALSAQSSLYPHVAHREKAYLFPAINDAEYVFLDVTSPSYPLEVGSLVAVIRSLLAEGQFGVVKAQDGYLLLRRGWPMMTGEAWRSFLTFTQNDEGVASQPAIARFGDVLELVGYNHTIHNVVTAGQLPASVKTCWRALRSSEQDYGFAFIFTRQDGAVVGEYSRPTPTTAWYPASAWRVGETVCMETPVLEIGRRKDVLVAVTLPLADPAASGQRLPVVPATGGRPSEVFQEGTLLRLFSFGDRPR